MNTLPRKLHIFGFFLILALVMAACAPTAAPTAASPAAPTTAPTGPLVVLEWSGYEVPELWQPFADAYPNVKVENSFFAEDAEAFSKLLSGFQADLVHPCAGWTKLYVDNDLIQPIDTTRLKNWSGVHEAFAKVGQVDGQQYLVPWDWGYDSILVRTDKVKTIPDSWADLWDPEYAGHVSIFDAGETASAVAALALGLKDPFNLTGEQREAVKQKLVELQPSLLTYWSSPTEVNQEMAAGDVWVVSNAWNESYQALRKEGIPVEYVEPKEGRLGWVCGYVMAKTSQNVDLAYAYLDARLAADSMTFLIDEFGYGASNTGALPLADPETVQLLALDRLDILERTVFYGPLTSEEREWITNMWNEVKAAP